MLQEVGGLARDHGHAATARCYRAAERCRICGGGLNVVADFGEHAIGSRFPLPGEPDPPRAPLTLCRCAGCGLVQLGQTVEPDEIWREGYGYWSGVNETMAAHLREIVADLRRFVEPGETVLDIGCNDGTLLKAWSAAEVYRAGFDPIAQDLPGAVIVRDYFDARGFEDTALAPAKVVTSIAMFYDLDEPVRFAKHVAAVLHPQGVWCLEVQYLGALLDGAWDGVCHEHLTYLDFTRIAEIAQRAGLRPFHVKRNAVNGGSIQVWLCHADAPHGWATAFSEPPRDFSALQHDIDRAAGAVRRCVREDFHGKRVYALGASTKGNTILQTAGLTDRDIGAAVDRNPDKVGRRLPGSGIPIIGEDEARSDPPDAFLVLPWHFRDQLLAREAALRGRCKFIFPLPKLEIV